jgi:hypothetical protein
MIKFKIAFLLIFPFLLFSQNEKFPAEKLKQDLTTFRQIREKANSGIYKYRTKKQIDSIYNWAFLQLKNPIKVVDFYKIILQITDFEGSVHNNTTLPDVYKNTSGKVFFPFPVKLINNKTIVNLKNDEIPLGSQIHSINGIEIDQVVRSFYKYYTTDGFNISGKSIGINAAFSRYFEMEYGPKETFLVEYSLPKQTAKLSKTITGISNEERKENFKKRHSFPSDSLFYSNIKDKYSFKIISQNTALLAVHTFAIGGNAEDKEHIVYKKYLDSCFQMLSVHPEIKNLIVDIRNNGGGSDPNDLVTFSYLTQKTYRENKSAYINFQKIPFLPYFVYEETETEKKLEEKNDFEAELKEEYPILKGKIYPQDPKFNHLLQPDKNTFKGQVYLLISPRIASAGSLFASLVAGKTNSIVIGEETMGGYFGHNGHTPIEYELPNTKIKTQFSIVNLEQDVPKKPNQIFGRGVIPDYKVVQTFDDFMENRDAQMEYVLKLIEKK